MKRRVWETRIESGERVSGESVAWSGHDGVGTWEVGSRITIKNWPDYLSFDTHGQIAYTADGQKIFGITILGEVVVWHLHVLTWVMDLRSGEFNVHRTQAIGPTSDGVRKRLFGLSTASHRSFEHVGYYWLRNPLQVSVIELKSGERITRVTLETMSEPPLADPVLCFQDGDIAIPSQGNIEIFNKDVCSYLCKMVDIDDPSERCFSISSDDETLAIGCQKNIFVYWIPALRPWASIDLDGAPVEQLCFAQNSKYLLCRQFSTLRIFELVPH